MSGIGEASVNEAGEVTLNSMNIEKKEARVGPQGRLAVEQRINQPEHDVIELEPDYHFLSLGFHLRKDKEG